MDWISVKDRLPYDDEPVLVTYVGYTDNLPYNDAVAVYAHKQTDNYAGAWYWQDSDGVDDNPVSVSITHWMPLPKLPEGGRMTDYLNPDKLYPDDISRRIDTPPGFDSVRASTGFQWDGGDKTERRCRSRPAEGCEHCAWIDTSRQHEDEDGPINYCRVCGRYLRNPGEAGTKID